MVLDPRFVSGPPPSNLSDNPSASMRVNGRVSDGHASAFSSTTFASCSPNVAELDHALRTPGSYISLESAWGGEPALVAPAILLTVRPSLAETARRLGSLGERLGEILSAGGTAEVFVPRYVSGDVAGTRVGLSGDPGGLVISPAAQALGLREPIAQALRGNREPLDSFVVDRGDPAVHQLKTDLFVTVRHLPLTVVIAIEERVLGMSSPEELRALCECWAGIARAFDAILEASRDLDGPSGRAYVGRATALLSAGRADEARRAALNSLADTAEEHSFDTFFDRWLPRVPDTDRREIADEVAAARRIVANEDRLEALYELRERVRESLLLAACREEIERVGSLAGDGHREAVTEALQLTDRAERRNALELVLKHLADRAVPRSVRDCAPDLGEVQTAA